MEDSTNSVIRVEPSEHQTLNVPLTEKLSVLIVPEGEWHSDHHETSMIRVQKLNYRTTVFLGEDEYEYDPEQRVYCKVQR